MFDLKTLLIAAFVALFGTVASAATIEFQFAEQSPGLPFAEEDRYTGHVQEGFDFFGAGGSWRYLRQALVPPDDISQLNVSRTDGSQFRFDFLRYSYFPQQFDSPTLTATGFAGNDQVFQEIIDLVDTESRPFSLFEPSATADITSLFLRFNGLEDATVFVGAIGLTPIPVPASGLLMLGAVAGAMVWRSGKGRRARPHAA